MLLNVLEEEKGDVDGELKTCIFIDVHIPPLFHEPYFIYIYFFFPVD